MLPFRIIPDWLQQIKQCLLTFIMMDFFDDLKNPHATYFSLISEALCFSMQTPFWSYILFFFNSAIMSCAKKKKVRPLHLDGHFQLSGNSQERA